MIKFDPQSWFVSITKACYYSLVKRSTSTVARLRSAKSSKLGFPGSNVPLVPVKLTLIALNAN